MNSIELATVDTLNKIRQRLLDLTARNKLLNFNRYSKQSIHIVDESASYIFQRLLAEKHLRFLAIEEPTNTQLEEFLATVPEKLANDENYYPTSGEWAKYKQINVVAEFCAAIDENLHNRHLDDALQTPYYEMEMENRLRTLYTLSQNALLETGCNVLYLAFGFLEWFDKNSDKTRLAPLLLMPIHLKKGVFNPNNHCYEYRIYYSDEALVENLSLKKRLQQDFDLELPEIDAFEDPENYLLYVQQMLENNQLSWQVKRYCYIAPFNFSKLIMYNELDPKRWEGTKHAIHNSRLVQSILLNLPLTYDESAAPFKDYAIDELDDKAHQKYPVIYSADSSQHSALIDVLTGKNLVIEGPPGTGKSQTIANIIAAAMNEGKSVLFVAEKRAALEVVKQKMTDAELDKFCLEIHSHKTSRKDFIESIRTRIELDDKKALPSKMQFQFSVYEQAKAKLLEYFYIVDTHWLKTGLSAGKILLRASYYQRLVGHNNSASIPIQLDGNTYTPEQALIIEGKTRDLTKALQLLEKHQRVIDSYSFYIWQGLSFESQKSPCLSALSAWIAVQKSISSRLDELYESMGVSRADLTISNVVRLPHVLSGLPARPKNKIDYIFPLISAHSLAEFEQYADNVKYVVTAQEQLAQVFEATFYSDELAIENAEKSLDWFESYGVRSQSYCDNLSQCVSVAQGLANTLLASKDRICQSMMTLFGHQSTAVPLCQSIPLLIELLQIVQDMPNRLLASRQENYEFELASRLLIELKEKLQQYKTLDSKLSMTFNLSDDLDLAQIKRQAQLYNDNRGFFCWLKPTWYHSRKYLKNLAHKGVGLKRVYAQLTDLYEYLELKAAINHDSGYAGIFTTLYDGVKTNIEDIEWLHYWYKRLFESHHRHLEVWHHAKTVLLSQSIAAFAQFKQAYCHHAYLTQLAALCDHFAQLTAQMGDLPLLGQTGEPADMIQNYAHFAPMIESQYAQLSVGLLKPNIALNSLNELFNVALTCLEKIHVLTRQNILEHNQHVDDILTTAGLQALNENRQFIQSAFKNKDLNLFDFILCCPDYKNISTLLIEGAQEMQGLVDQENELKARFIETGKLDINLWLVTSKPKYAFLLKRNIVALSNEPAFDDQLFTARCAHDLGLCGLSKAMDRLIEQNIPSSEVHHFILSAIYCSLAKEICYQYPQCSDFSVIEHEVLRKEYQVLDNQLLQLQRGRIRYNIREQSVPAGRKADKVGELTDFALIQHEANKKIRHISIREHIRRAGNALMKLKPCFMMSPMSAAQYLDVGNFQFDLVIFDEASQLKPVDAIGVIARAKQVVVVGDSRQLPPTSFFERDQDDSEQIIEDTESILTACKGLFYNRRLNWHYRSQHPDLIDFSNHRYYESSLITFPSPYNHHSDFGIKYLRVKEGHFVNQHNIEEARVVVAVAANHLKHFSDQSIGIVTMNSAQRLAIEKLFEGLCKTDESLRKALDHYNNCQSPFFIKNLENVQGDERDVMLISLTYGPRESYATSMHQRFGAINSETGWRRLNVLFSRAKKRMHIFSSMDSQMIKDKTDTSFGVKSLKQFLLFCEKNKTGERTELDLTTLDYDKEVVSVLAEVLQENGYRVERNIGIKGCVINLAVAKPQVPDRYILGIVVDGDAYLEGRTVSERDNIKDAVLTAMGWELKYIWSPSWHRHAEQEINEILHRLETIKTPLDVKQAENEEQQIALMSKACNERFDKLCRDTGKADSITNALMDYDLMVMKKAFPDTLYDRRLLREPMMKRFIRHKPTNHLDFEACFEKYLTVNTEPAELSYLDNLFTILARFE